MGTDRFNGAFGAGFLLMVSCLIGTCLPSNRPDAKPVSDEVVINSSTEPEPKKEDPKPEPKPASKDGTIVMYTSDGCIWCQKWKQVEMPKVVAATWKYEEVYVSDGPVPRFDVHVRGKIIKHTGYMSMTALRKIVDGQ